MKRRIFIGSSLAALAGCRPGVEITSAENFTIAELAVHLRSGQLSVGRVLEHYLHRIAMLDQAGPMLRCILEINPEAKFAQAKGPLRGIPILIKDNIETADAMETTAGSLALLGAKKPERDAFIVERLRAAGATILGKTNLSEWANIRSPNSTSGWSARGGLTLNPHNLAHSASGSSSGSAAAVAAGLCAAAIGTETNGSIISPASACGIVGLKPTVGLISRSGIIPITHWQDTAGPMTQNVWDAALLLNLLAGVDERDSFTAKAQGRIDKDYTFGLAADGLKGKRLGIVRSFCGHHRQVRQLFEENLEKLRQAGAVLVDEVTIPHHREAGAASWRAMLTEFRQELNDYLSTRGAAVKSLAELISYNEEYRAQEMPYFNQEFFIEAESRHTPELIAEGVKLRALALRLAGPDGLDEALKKDKLDALICPTNDPAGRIDLGMGDAHVRVASTPAAVAGYPHLTVPMGLVGGLPIGLSFMGAAWSEALLLQLGHGFEKVREYQPVRLYS